MYATGETGLCTLPASCCGREVKAMDSKSVGVSPRRFESCRQRAPVQNVPVSWIMSQQLAAAFMFYTNGASLWCSTGEMRYRKSRGELGKNCVTSLAGMVSSNVVFKWLSCVGTGSCLWPTVSPSWPLTLQCVEPKAQPLSS